MPGQRTHAGRGRGRRHSRGDNLERDRRNSPSCPPHMQGNGGTALFFRQNPTKLKRCESTRHRHHATPASRLFAKHRNSAPTTLFLRSPTPHIEITEVEEITFGHSLSVVVPRTPASSIKSRWSSIHGLFLPSQL
uniref:Uncharacterized protein n=1 Tax=Panagrellus redivivus TaxID=6233 RepID=A0A7E4VB24_PANRE